MMADTYKYKVRYQEHKVGEQWAGSDADLNGYGADGYELVSVVLFESSLTALMYEIWYLKKKIEAPANSPS